MSLGKRDRPRVTGTRGDWDQTPNTARDKPAKAAKKRARVNPVSAKTAARRDERKAITDTHGTCAMAHHGGCAGPVDTHEMVRRSQMTEAAYTPELCIGLCRHTHHPVDTNRLEAERRGIRIPRWVWDRDGIKAVHETARLRALPNGGTPYWWVTEE